MRRPCDLLRTLHAGFLRGWARGWAARRRRLRASGGPRPNRHRRRRCARLPLPPAAPGRLQLAAGAAAGAAAALAAQHPGAPLRRPGPRDTAFDTRVASHECTTYTHTPRRAAVAMPRAVTSRAALHSSPQSAMTTGLTGRSPRSQGLFSIFCTSSMPSSTCPNTTCLPSSHAAEQQAGAAQRISTGCRLGSARERARTRQHGGDEELRARRHRVSHTRKQRDTSSSSCVRGSPGSRWCWAPRWPWTVGPARCACARSSHLRAAAVSWANARRARVRNRRTHPRTCCRRCSCRHGRRRS